GRAQRDARVARRHQRPELLLFDVADALDAFRSESLHIEARRCGSDQQKLRARMTLSHQAERLDQLWDALARIEMTEAAEERPAVDLRGENLCRGPSGMLDPPNRTAVAGLERAVLHIVRVNDQTGGVGEHLAGERELIGARLPRGR